MFDGRIVSGISVFVAVSEAGNYARASKLLGLSRSGVGKAIVRLEDRTGMKLFDRNSRALKLTPDGRLFLDTVRPLLERIGEAAVPRNAAEIRGHIRVSCDAAFGTYLLMPRLATFLKRHPGLRIDILVRDRIDNFLVEGVDVAVRFGEPQSPDLDKQLLLRSRVLTCASPEYIRVHGLPADPEALRHGHCCVGLMDDSTGKPYPWRFERQSGEAIDIVAASNLSVNDATSLLTAVHAGMGMGRLLDFMVGDDLEAGRLVEVLPDWNWRSWPAYLYTPARAPRSAALDAFRAFISEEASSLDISPPPLPDSTLLVDAAPTRGAVAALLRQ